jgi:hypothetical protein
MLCVAKFTCKKIFPSIQTYFKLLQSPGLPGCLKFVMPIHVSANFPEYMVRLFLPNPIWALVLSGSSGLPSIEN